MSLVVPHNPTYAPHLPPIFAGMNRAGSVGKTTLGYNLCVQAARRGYKVLLIDADLQSDASYWSGWDGDAVKPGEKTIHDVMLGTAKLKDAIVPGRTRIGAGDDDSAFEIIPNLYLVRGDKAMSQADGELMLGDAFAVFWLQNALREGLAEGDFDLIYIDAPASLGRLSISLLIAATDIIMCMKPTKKELRGSRALAQIVNETREARGRYGASATASYVFMNEGKKHESQGKFYSNMQKLVEEMYGDALLGMLTTVVRVPEAYDAQEPLVIWDPQEPSVKVIDSVLDKLGYPELAPAA